MKTIGVVLSGCGVMDGAEIHESVVTLLAIDRAGARAKCIAPNIDQMHVVNHQTNEPSEGRTRNVMEESARIARGAVSDIEATIASVNRLRTVPARVWITAHEHGVFESDPGELWDRYLGVIDERESKLLDLLAVPRKMNEIVDARILYGKKREPKEFYDFGERSHMGKHLERLIRQGVVICDEGTYCRA